MTTHSGDGKDRHYDDAAKNVVGSAHEKAVSSRESCDAGQRHISPYRLLRALVCLLIIVTIGLSAPSMKRREATVSAREIALDLKAFLRGLRDKEPYYGSRECVDASSCDELKDPNLLPVAAWQILGEAGVIMLGDDTGIDRIRSYFDGWKRRSSLGGEHFSLHQLYPGYLISKNQELFWVIWGQSQSYLATMKSAVAKNRPLPFTSYSTLAATMSRQLSNALRLMNDPSHLDTLVGAGQFPRGEQQIQELRADLLEYALRLSERARELMIEEGVRPLITSPRLEQWSCWIPWAAQSHFDATGDSKHLEEVRSFIRMADFHRRSPADTKPLALQSILPCLEILIRQKDVEPSAAKGYRMLLESFVLKMWDSKRSPLCGGKGGVLSRIELGSNPCVLNSKTSADNAWLLFLMSEIPDDEFTLPVNR